MLLSLCLTAHTEPNKINFTVLRIGLCQTSRVSYEQVASYYFLPLYNIYRIVRNLETRK